MSDAEQYREQSEQQLDKAFGDQKNPPLTEFSRDKLLARCNDLIAENIRLRNTITAYTEAMKKAGLDPAAYGGPQAQARRWISASEAALAVGVSERSLLRIRRRYPASFPAPFVTPDRRNMFNAEALLEFKQSHPQAFYKMRTKARKTI